MNKKVIMTAILGAMTMGVASAQQLTPNDVKEIQSSFVQDGATSGLQNALTQETSLKKLALNRQLQGKVDHYFKYRVDVKGITDQKQSGRCWMFTSMNVLRPRVMKQLNIGEFDFSHNYNYFWDIFEKSNLFLTNAIATADREMTDRDVEFYFKNPVSDGGVWNLFFNIAQKYGVVPQSVMPETAHSNNTGQMVSLINQRLRAGSYALRQMVNEKQDATTVSQARKDILKDVYRILALCLGTPPTEFTWRYETADHKIKTLHTTPQEFFKSIIPNDYAPDTYVMIMNDPTRPYYQTYEIQNYRNTAEGINWIYLNLPNDVIKKAAVASIKNNEPMYASCDIVQYNSETGICDSKMYDYEALLGVKMNMDKKARILTRQSGSAHAMTLIAVDTDDNDKPLKWQFENSWGPSAGHEGYMTFTDQWFDDYMFRLVIRRQYLDSESLKALKTTPVQLPAWDYMF